MVSRPIKPKISNSGEGSGRVAVIVDDELNVVVAVGGRDKGIPCWIGNIGIDYLIGITWMSTATSQGYRHRLPFNDSGFGLIQHMSLRHSL